jgi:hypothetical protein
VTGIADFLTANPWAVLGLRMLLVASFVVLVAVLAEKLGPFLGAMVASLPLYTGPVYLMLALEHDGAWFLQATLGSIAICGATPVFALVYCILARTRGVAISVSGALLAWLALAIALQANTWTLPEALLFVAPIYVVAVLLAQGFTRGIAPARAERRWFDLGLRAVLVSICSTMTVKIGALLPPQASGILSVAPILMTSIALVLHPRVGGRATAALFAHTLSGLVGMVIAFAVVHLAIVPVGLPMALLSGLAVTVAWNLLLIALKSAWGARRKSAASAIAAAPRPAPTAVIPPPSLPPPRRPVRQSSVR